MKNSSPKPPRHLSPEAKVLWRIALDLYDLDEVARSVLAVGLEAHDRMRQAQALLKRDGLIVVDRFNQQKPNPAAIIERDSRTSYVKCLHMLGLDLEPLQGPGRPAGK